jgi:restriction system protein
MTKLRHPTLQPRQSPLRATVQTVLVSGTLLLMLTWLSAWLLGLGQPVVLATTLLVVIVGVAAIGLRLGLDSAASGPMPTSQTTAEASQAGEQQPLYDPASTPLQGKNWSLEVFATIDAQRFAAVCETWFSWAGFDTRHESHRTHQGVDIWLHAARLPGPVAIVRCQHAQDKPVGLQELRDFQGFVSTCRPAHGTFTTTSTYTPEALQFAKENDIEVVDGRGLLRKILTRARQSQQALLAVAYHGR